MYTMKRYTSLAVVAIGLLGAGLAAYIVLAATILCGAGACTGTVAADTIISTNTGTTSISGLGGTM